MKGILKLSSDYQATKTPNGYKRAVEQKVLLFSMYGNISEQTALIKYWENTTKVKTADSKFSIMIPIRNEEKTLEAATRSLFQSFLPEDVEAHIDFILNDCTDRSESIILNCLHLLGDVSMLDISKEALAYYQDAGIYRKYIEVKKGNNFWRVYKTKTIGKANAIKLGSALAIYRDHRILISIDANNYVEQDTLALMFKSAYKHFIMQSDDTVIISAIPKKEYKGNPCKLECLLREHGVFNDAAYTPVYGWCMALNTEWSFKNIQFVAVEDYALGVVARSQDKKIALVEDAKIWGYKTNLSDSFIQFRRYIRGIFQLLNLRPDLREIIMSDHYIMRSFPKRIWAIAQEIKSNPKKSVRCLWKFIYGEFGLALGKLDYKRNPHNQSWIELASTK